MKLISNASTPERPASSQPLGERIAAALNGLSWHERAAFTPPHYEGVPLLDIGETLGLSENATKQCICRAVKNLRRALLPWITLT